MLEELTSLRADLVAALERLDALVELERARDVRRQQVDLLCIALDAMDPRALLSRWAAAQRLAALVQSRTAAMKSGRRPARDSERLVDEALALGSLPRSASRLWRLLPARQKSEVTLSVPQQGGSLWDD